MERSEIEQLVRAVIARLEADNPKIGSIKTESFSDPSVASGDKDQTRMVSSDAYPDVIPVEMSARHIHLSLEDLQNLFGTNTLPDQQAISQPGQYLSQYRVRLIGPKGILDHVAVLGPVRSFTQVEISATDSRTLGIDAPVRISGDLTDAAMVCIQAGEKMIQKPCAIVAKRHVHMTPGEAEAFQVCHGDEIALMVEGERPLTFQGVTVRVSPQSALALHIDTDEANAAGAWKDTVCSIGKNAQPAVQGFNSSSKKPSVPVQPETMLESKLISERDVLALQKTNTKILRIKKGQIITPLAIDALKTCGIALIREGQG